MSWHHWLGGSLRGLLFYFIVSLKSIVYWVPGRSCFHSSIFYLALFPVWLHVFSGEWQLSPSVFSMGIASHWQYLLLLRLFWLSDHMRSLSWLLPCAPRHENFHHEGKLLEVPSAQGDFSAQLAFGTQKWPFQGSQNCGPIIMGKLRPKWFAADWELTVCAYKCDTVFKGSSWVHHVHEGWACTGSPPWVTVEMRATAFVLSSWLIHSAAFYWFTAEDSSLEAIQVWSNPLPTVWNLLGFAIGGQCLSIILIRCLIFFLFCTKDCCTSLVIIKWSLFRRQANMHRGIQGS